MGIYRLHTFHSHAFVVVRLGRRFGVNFKERRDNNRENQMIKNCGGKKSN